MKRTSSYLVSCRCNPRRCPGIFVVETLQNMSRSRIGRVSSRHFAPREDRSSNGSCRFVDPGQNAGLAQDQMTLSTSQNLTKLDFSPDQHTKGGLKRRAYGGNSEAHQRLEMDACSRLPRYWQVPSAEPNGDESQSRLPQAFKDDTRMS